MCESCDSGYFVQARNRDCRLLSDVFDATVNTTCSYETVFDVRNAAQSVEWCAQECDATLGCEAFSYIRHFQENGQSDDTCKLHNNTCTNDLANATLVQSDSTLYVVFERWCLSISIFFSCFNYVTQIRRTSLTSHTARKITRISTLECTLECYESLPSAPALEHKVEHQRSNTGTPSRLVRATVMMVMQNKQVVL